MAIRYLGHDGLYHYFAGTTHVGELMWTTDSAFAVELGTNAAVQRILQKCVAEGIDAEVCL